MARGFRRGFGGIIKRLLYLNAGMEKDAENGSLEEGSVLFPLAERNHPGVRVAIHEEGKYSDFHH
jgi:hypothetical protein